MGEVETTLKCIIKSSNLEYCVVVTSCHHAVDSFSKQPVRDFSAGDDKSSYNRLEEDLLLWMGNVNFTSEVFYRPLYLVSPSPKLFLIPRFRRLTSLLAPDMVACLNIWKNLMEVMLVPNHVTSRLYTALEKNYKSTIERGTRFINVKSVEKNI